MKLFLHLSFGAISAPKLLFAGYLLLILSAVLVGVFSYRKLPTPYRLLTQLLTLIFLSELLGTFLGPELGSNYPFYHFLTIIQLLYYGAIFYFLFKNFKKNSLWMLLVAIALTLISLWTTFFYQSIFEFPSISNALLALYVVIMSLTMFFKMVKTPEQTRILLQPAFWFGSGSLFFYTITFFIFGYYDLLLKGEEFIPDWYSPLIHGSNYLLYTCYLITIFLATKQNRPTP